jgi:Zn-dependent peptidase ImmA (M78 family)
MKTGTLRYSTYKDVVGAADHLLTISGAPRLDNGIAIDAERIARGCCRFDVAEIADLNLGGPVLGAFIPEFDLIMLKHNCLDVRKRFSLAHELGHAQLEHSFGKADSLFACGAAAYFRCEEGDIDAEGPTRKQRPRAEVLANKFAANLLMPEATLREVAQRKPSIAEAAALLMVSRQALRIRFEELDLPIPEGDPRP